MSLMSTDGKWLPSDSSILYKHDLAKDLGITKISKLMVARNWNKPLIEAVYCRLIAAEIQPIPLSLHDGENLLGWPTMGDGKYTSKCGYRSICDNFAV